MATQLPFNRFLQASGPIFDVRSPGEYGKGHLPGSVSFPLFSDEERAAVGTCYKQKGRDQAVELGLEFVGPRMASFVQQAKQLAPERQVRLYCWRGGMRSGSLGWLLETAGFNVVLLNQGYKAFRRWVRDEMTRPQPIFIVGGMTGTGKTLILQALADLGEQVLDLEGLAHHRGSSYGNLCLPPQPSTEHFENLIATLWNGYDPSKPVWIEAESVQVGRCRIPPEIFKQMERASVFEIQRSLTERLTLLETIYGEANQNALIEATNRIGRRLGHQRTQSAIDWIKQGKLAPAIEIVLAYYDKTYRYDLDRRDVPSYPVNAEGLPPREAAKLLLNLSQQHQARDD